MFTIPTCCRFLFTATCILLLGAPVAAQDIDVEYGVVSDVVANRTSGDGSGAATGAAAGGALGGLLGATSSKANSSGEKRRRSLFYGAAGALAGGAAGSAAGGGGSTTIYTYTVALLDGGSFNITTEQGHIDAGDCVSIERGSTNNIRKVAQVFCDVPGDSVYSEHVTEAAECSAAKQELVAAQGGEAIDAAIRKVKILCDD